MANFNEDLVNYLRAADIDNIEVYAEGFPAVKSSTPHMVSVNSSGELNNDRNREQTNYTRRFLVTGKQKQAIAKAWEIYNFFIPQTSPVYNSVTSFKTDSYYVAKVFSDREPHSLQNRNNIYIVQFILRFMTALL